VLAHGWIIQPFRPGTGATGESSLVETHGGLNIYPWLLCLHIWFQALTSFRGCFTPKQIVNVRKDLTADSEDLDFSRLDGFNELTNELQEKIRKAIELGHIEDEEWKGVSSPSSICTLGSFAFKMVFHSVDQLILPRTLNSTVLDMSACVARVARLRPRPMRFVDSILYPHVIRDTNLTPNPRKLSSPLLPISMAWLIPRMWTRSPPRRRSKLVLRRLPMITMMPSRRPHRWHWAQEGQEAWPRRKEDCWGPSCCRGGWYQGRA
jgi:Poly(ADP-ribose) polymerase and DNA-Ligase Zn-finger region.